MTTQPVTVTVTPKDLCRLWNSGCIRSNTNTEPINPFTGFFVKSSPSQKWHNKRKVGRDIYSLTSSSPPQPPPYPASLWMLSKHLYIEIKAYIIPPPPMTQLTWNKHPPKENENQLDTKLKSENRRNVSVDFLFIRTNLSICVVWYELYIHT